MVKYTENIIPRAQREAAVSVTAVSGPSTPGSRRELHVGIAECKLEVSSCDKHHAARRDRSD